MTKQGPLRVAIAGYGVVGKRRREHIDSFANLQTVAVCDRTVDGDGVLKSVCIEDKLRQIRRVLLLRLGLVIRRGRGEGQTVS